MTFNHQRPDRVRGVGLFASLGPRPHRALRVGQPRALWALLSAPLVGPLTRQLLRPGLRLAGFPSEAPVEALVHVMRLLAGLDFAGHARALRTLPVPALVVWTEDDRLISSDIFDELAESVPGATRLTWTRGGHFFPKSRAVELADALVAWMAGLS